MLICGIKPTHDGALALIDNGKLIFSYEMEKLNNNNRYKNFDLSLSEIENILNSYGYTFSQIDRWVIDGWGADVPDERTVMKDIDFGTGRKVDMPINKYGNLVGNEENVMAYEDHRIEAIDFSYTSFLHVSGHIASAYCTSPFAVQEEGAFIITWDGGMPPQMFYFDYRNKKVENLGPLMYIFGCIYTDLPHRFHPFCLAGKHISIAGKVMAYIALGESRSAIIAEYRAIYERLTKKLPEGGVDGKTALAITEAFIDQAEAYCTANQCEHADMMASMHFFLQELLMENIEKKVNENPGLTRNLCFAGGSALNIKWNSKIRSSKIFDEVWVPPFPNDSGSALGAACCAMIAEDNKTALDWNVYAGPPLINESQEHDLYETYPCTLKELAAIIHHTNEPILFLNGRAELGPRALGNRSILAAAVSPGMKEQLNKVKIREAYRPIAPICLEEDAPKVFDPGTPDPYMLFDHMVREDWKEKVPAVIHLDGSSRLQTVNEMQNPLVYELLSHYKAISGVPLLCNTSANLKGSGFFPDINSPMEWGRVNFIWNAGRLYARQGAFDPSILSIAKKEAVSVSYNSI